ncbi:MAG: hypothetical protein LC772_12900 [Chloroflexi bacterium]|nr:hypothetical protein [Chloroflexota bacterium]
METDSARPQTAETPEPDEAPAILQAAAERSSRKLVRLCFWYAVVCVLCIVLVGLVQWCILPKLNARFHPRTDRTILFTGSNLFVMGILAWMAWILLKARQSTMRHLANMKEIRQNRSEAPADPSTRPTVFNTPAREEALRRVKEFQAEIAAMNDEEQIEFYRSRLQLSEPEARIVAESLRREIASQRETAQATDSATS